MQANALIGTTAVPLIVALIQAAKTAGLPSCLAPIAALTLGLAAGVLSVWQAANGGAIVWPAAVILGLTWGVAASGLYETARTAHSAVRAARAPNPYPAPEGRSQLRVTSSE